MSGPNHIGAFERRVRALCEGFRRELPPSVERVRLGGEEMPFAEVLAALQAMESTFDAVHDARQRYRQAVGDRRRAMKAHRSTYEDMVVFLKHYLGKASPRLTSFGVALPKGRRALTAEASAIARAKAAATRKARGVLGKRQRLALGRPREPTLQVFGPDGLPLAPDPSTSLGTGRGPETPAGGSADATVAPAEPTPPG